MTDALRCSAWARQEQVDAIGTAGSYAGYLLVEWPLPWPKDIADVPELREVAAVCAAKGLRLQGLVVAASRTERRVILYRRADPIWFARFDRMERASEPAEVANAAVELAGGAPGAGVTGGNDAVDCDVLVCTHGRRDACCGSRGTALANELAVTIGQPGGLDAGVHVWRTSHTGGHRFAPTAIALPHGTVWAFLDTASLTRIARREGPLDDLLPRYRGCAGIGPRAVQALEREALAQIGWQLLDWRRRGLVNDDGGLRLEAISPVGEVATWTARALASRALPVPVCGQPLDGTEKTETEVVLQHVTRVG